MEALLTFFESRKVHFNLFIQPKWKDHICDHLIKDLITPGSEIEVISGWISAHLDSLFTCKQTRGCESTVTLRSCVITVAGCDISRLQLWHQTLLFTLLITVFFLEKKKEELQVQLSVTCHLMLPAALPDDLLGEHRVHGLLVKHRVLFHHLSDAEGHWDSLRDASHYLLHNL